MYNMKGMPTFYRDMLSICAQYNSLNSKTPKTLNEIKKQILWGNKYIVINKTPIFNKMWIESGITTIEDIVDNNGFKSSEEIVGKLISSHNWMSEFMKIKIAIPSTWMNMFNVDNHLQSVLKIEPIYSKNSKVKHFYKGFLTNNTYIPNVQSKWEKELNLQGLEWCNIWYKKVYCMKHVSKIGEFNFKLLHKILCCKKKLKLWNLSESDLCERCSQEIDDEKHMIAKCEKIKQVNLINSINAR